MKDHAAVGERYWGRCGKSAPLQLAGSLDTPVRRADIANTACWRPPSSSAHANRLARSEWPGEPDPPVYDVLLCVHERPTPISTSAQDATGRSIDDPLPTSLAEGIG